jgi:S1-C subfamily serine protease
MASAVARAATSTVLIAGRRGYPASGVVFGPDLILTANHVLERDEDITTLLPDGQKAEARVLGRDPGSDLGLVRIEKTAVQLPELAKEPPRVGELVLALARPTDEGIQASMGVVGIVNGNYRTWREGRLEGVIRTDARRYPGFAGGPLVDIQGSVLGVNVLGYGHTSAITIPAQSAWSIAETLSKQGSIRRGYLGVRSQVIDIPANVALHRDQESQRDQATGLIVVGIEQGGPAEKAGMLVGDILVDIQGEAVEDHEVLISLLRRIGVDSPVRITLIRAGKVETLELKTGSRS